MVHQEVEPRPEHAALEGIRVLYQRITQPCDPDVDVTLDREAIRFAGHEHVLERAPMLGDHSERILREIVGCRERTSTDSC